VPQHDDLKLLEAGRAKTQQHERHQPPDHHVQERRHTSLPHPRQSQRHYGPAAIKTPAANARSSFGTPQACSGQEGSILSAKLRPPGLAAKNIKLMAQHDDLKLLELRRAPAQ
jgi:hypothetical protein